MKISLPFELGDPLYWVNFIKTETEVPDLAEAKKTDLRIHGFSCEADGKVFVKTDYDEYEELGSQYALLSMQEAENWIDKNLPGAIRLDGRVVDAVYIDRCGEMSIRPVALSMEELDALVSGKLVAGEPDVNGIFAIYNEFARNSNKPVTRVTLDTNGRPVGVMFGEFLLLQLTPDRKGIQNIDRKLFEEG